MTWASSTMDKHRTRRAGGSENSIRGGLQTCVYAPLGTRIQELGSVLSEAKLYLKEAGAGVGGSLGTERRWGVTQYRETLGFGPVVSSGEE